ncbi:MAG: PAS domain-containing protein, partial [Acholeplasmataceae bacterium]
MIFYVADGMSIQAAIDAGMPFEVTYRILTKSGETKWMWERGQGVNTSGEDKDLLEGFITDITERKQREGDLERYEAYLQESTDIITVLNLDGTVKYQSPAVERILGYQSGELVAQNGFDFIHSDDFNAVKAAFDDLV